jgi:hypothetical protein
VALLAPLTASRPVQTADAASLDYVFGAIADTYADREQPSVNFGSAGRIASDRSPRQVAYVKFEVGALPGSIQSARLRLWVENGSTVGGGIVAATTTGWSESALTWDRRPAANGATLATIGPVTRGHWVEIDVTSAVTGAGRVSFGIRPSSYDGVEYATREGTDGRAPQLVVTVDTSLPSAIALPGTIEAEHYRPGGEGVGYHDETSGNAGALYRDDDVDIQSCNDPVSGDRCLNVGWTRPGEWLSYAVHVETAGTYTFAVRYATEFTVRWLRVEIDGVEVVPRLDLPNTGSAATWATATTPPIEVSAGDHELRITLGQGGVKLNSFTVAREGSVVLVGAADIARCGSDGDEATADLLDTLPGTVVTLGDNAYPDGSADDFANCYAPSWGRHKERTRPAIGNHEWVTPDAAGYFDYFGNAAGEAGQGWYSYDAGAWHVVVLNSSCSKNGGCDPDDPQAEWLRADLAANPSTCTLAYWHHPRWSSGEYGDDANMQTYWDILDAAGADVILNGHSHNYERFDKLDATGTPDPEGMRQFIVGTGGGGLSRFSTIHPSSAARDDQTYGVLRLTLHLDSYDWQFIPIAGHTFTDVGSDTRS